MRKDRIEEKAYRMALELYYSEGGFHGSGIDAEDVPVLRPEVSRLKRQDEPWEPNSAFYGNKPVGSPGKRSFADFTEESGGPEFDAMHQELHDVMERINEVGGRLRAARQRGNFAEEHRLVQERNDLLKLKSAIDARMAVNDLGRQQREQNDEMMYGNHDGMSFSEYASAIEENDRMIAELEAEFLAFAEGKNLKSPGGDFAADPGQTYDKADEEEEDEEDEEEEEEEEDED